MIIFLWQTQVSDHDYFFPTFNKNVLSVVYYRHIYDALKIFIVMKHSDICTQNEKKNSAQKEICCTYLERTTIV